MKIITDEIKQTLLPCVATIGCFDGLHRGIVSSSNRFAKKPGKETSTVLS